MQFGVLIPSQIVVIIRYGCKMFQQFKEVRDVLFRPKPHRDSGRIPIVLKRIEEIWTQFPDLRLMQLLLNMDVTYYTEDDALIKKLEKLYGKQE